MSEADDIDPLALRATPHRVRVATRGANLSDSAVRRAVEIVTATPAPVEWRRFLSRTLALFATGLLLAGAVCFVAYNWARIGRFGKFALVELAIVAATVLAWEKLPRLSGQLALLAAAVLVGPLLAIYGQTYQTGADPYGLFLTWFLLILPWAVAANFAAIWMVAILLLDLSLILFYAQMIAPSATEDALVLPLLVAALHATAIRAWEWQVRRGNTMSREHWALRAIGILGFIAISIPAIAFVLEDASAGWAGIAGMCGLVAAVAGTLRYYGRARRDRFMVTLAVVAGMAWVMSLAARVIFDWLGLEELGMFVMAGFVIWEITFGLRWYRRTRAP